MVMVVTGTAMLILGGDAKSAGPRAFTPAQNQDSPRLTYTKVLKGSTPEYISISVDVTGAGKYEGRKLDDPPQPYSLKLSPSTTRRLFELAEAMGNFKSGDLESHKKVANMGLKTFIYESGGEKHQAQFNYSLNRTAQELCETFEKIGAVEQHLAALRYEVKYDHLGLPKELLQIQIDLDNKALADPELLVPTLDEIARNPRFMHLAQVRAQSLLERLGQSPPGAAD